MTSTYSPVSQLVDEEWGLVRDDLLPPRSDVVSDLVNDTVDTNSCLENQVGMLKSMVEMQGKEIRNLKSRATLSNSQNSLVPSNSTASLLVDTTPILSEELCLEMSKIYIESRCGKGAAFLRLGELAEVYPLAAAFHFVAEFQYRDDKAWNEPFPIKSSVLYLRHVCSEKASKEFFMLNSFWDTVTSTVMAKLRETKRLV